MRVLFNFSFFTPYFLKINCINNLLLIHVYKLSFANSDATHEVSAAREPISVAKKQQQLTLNFLRRLRYSQVSI